MMCIGVPDFYVQIPAGVFWTGVTILHPFNIICQEKSNSEELLKYLKGDLWDERENGRWLKKPWTEVSDVNKALSLS